MITTLLFDLDETILDFKKAEAAALSGTLQLLGIEPTKETVALYSEINLKHWKMLERGEITRQQVQIGRFEELFSKLGVSRDPVETKSIYEGKLGQGHYFKENALEVLKDLEKNYRLYLVSNGTASVQEGRIKSAGIEPLFQDIFISEIIGHNKPSVEYFNYCFERIPDFSKDETIIIGDSLTSDIRGGNNAGIKTCWYNPERMELTEDVHVDIEIHKLSELASAIRKYNK